MLIEEVLLGEAKKQFKKKPGSSALTVKYRCTSGKKKGKLVTDPGKCGKRPDPKAVRRGKKAARVKKSLRVLKTKIAKNKPVSKIIKKINRRLMGKTNNQR